MDRCGRGMTTLFGGEGGFGMRASGDGEALVSSTQFQLRRAVEGRTIQSAKSAEGWVFDFAGPGLVLLQSRNPEAFIEWVVQAVAARIQR